MNFDEMDIEPNNEPPGVRKVSPFSVDSAAKNDESNNDEELQSQLLLRTVPLDDGCIGYVFTCTKNGPLATWRCHACNFVDTWKNLLKHIDTKWHQDSMSKYQHSRSNFSKIENVIPEISKGQPLPPGMEDVIAGPCQILKTLETYEQPLIGLEFLLELNMIDFKEPRYLCLLCDKRGDPRSILVHLTSQSHYLMYLRKYFRKFYSLIDKLPKSNECRSNVGIVTSHLIAKLEERYGRLQPTATRDDVINTPEQRTIILQRIDNSVHFSESTDDAYLEEMLTVDYVQNPSLLLKNFPLKPKIVDVRREEENNTKSIFNKSSKVGSNKKHLRGRDNNKTEHEESPDVVFVSSARPPPEKSEHRIRSRERSRSPRMVRSSRSPRPSRPYSRNRSRSVERSRRRYISPSYYRSLRYHRSRSRSPRRHRPRSPGYDRDRHYRRMSPSFSKFGSKSSYPRRSPSMKSVYSSRYRGRSKSDSPRSRDRSPHHRNRNNTDSVRTISGMNSPNENKERERFDGGPKFVYLREVKELEEKKEKEIERFTKIPEDHPAYQDEWKKFWCARFKELQNEGKCDPHTYDYKPEWISFWNVRVKEMFDKEFEDRRKSLKIKYSIVDEEKPVRVKTENRSKSGSPFEGEKKPVVDIKTMWKELTGFEIKDEKPSKRKSLSPWEDSEDTENDQNGSSKTEEKKSGNVLDDVGTQPISPEPLSSISDVESLDRSPVHRTRSRSRSYSRSRSRSISKSRSYSKERPFKEDYRKPTKKIHFENPLNIITVLRQLSVLEFQLGSYASHVISLLSSGLAMEKVKPQSSIDLLTKENVIFLELVKEKLKGQLLAGVVQKAMVKATLFCIKNIEELLLLVPKLKHTVPPPVPAPPPGLLYGAGVEPLPQAVPPAPTALPYGAHVYGAYSMPPGGAYKAMPIYKPFERIDKYKDRYPFRKSPPKRAEEFLRLPSPERYRRSPEKFPFRTKPTIEEPPKPKPAVPVIEEEIPIDKKLIAQQIAEALTLQGKYDVSNEELQTLINTIVEDLKQQQRNKGPGVDNILPKEPSVPPTVPIIPAVPAVTSVPNIPFQVPTIPAGFNLNDVSNTTLALLKDAFANASTISVAQKAAPEPFPENELIQLLRNFKNIERSEQQKLIEYLRKLEDTNPERVEELKKYVNVL